MTLQETWAMSVILSTINWSLKETKESQKNKAETLKIFVLEQIQVFPQTQESTFYLKTIIQDWSLWALAERMEWNYWNTCTSSFADATSAHVIANGEGMIR